MPDPRPPRSRARRLAAVGAALALSFGVAACGDDDGDLELPPGPTEPTVPDTAPTQDPTGDPDPAQPDMVPGGSPGPIDDDVLPPGAGGGAPGETPE